MRLSWRSSSLVGSGCPFSLKVAEISEISYFSEASLS
jgi:hypothetical protein